MPQPEDNAQPVQKTKPSTAAMQPGKSHFFLKLLIFAVLLYLVWRYLF